MIWQSVMSCVCGNYQKVLQEVDARSVNSAGMFYVVALIDCLSNNNKVQSPVKPLVIDI